MAAALRCVDILEADDSAVMKQIQATGRLFASTCPPCVSSLPEDRVCCRRRSRRPHVLAVPSKVSPSPGGFQSTFPCAAHRNPRTAGRASRQCPPAWAALTACVAGDRVVSKCHPQLQASSWLTVSGPRPLLGRCRSRCRVLSPCHSSHLTTKCPTNGQLRNWEDAPRCTSHPPCMLGTPHACLVLPCRPPSTSSVSLRGSPLFCSLCLQRSSSSLITPALMRNFWDFAGPSQSSGALWRPSTGRGSTHTIIGTSPRATPRTTSSRLLRSLERPLTPSPTPTAEMTGGRVEHLD